MTATHRVSTDAAAPTSVSRASTVAAPRLSSTSASVASTSADTAVTRPTSSSVPSVPSAVARDPTTSAVPAMPTPVRCSGRRVSHGSQHSAEAQPAAARPRKGSQRGSVAAPACGSAAYPASTVAPIVAVARNARPPETNGGARRAGELAAAAATPVPRASANRVATVRPGAASDHAVARRKSTVPVPAAA